PVGNPAGLQGLQSVVTKGELISSQGLSGSTASVHAAVLDTLRYQHGLLHSLLGSFLLLLFGKHFALINPYLDADLPVRRLCLGEAVVDVGPQGVQRDASLRRPLGPRDLRPAQSTGDPDLHAEGSGAHGALLGLAHRPPERD